MAEIDASMQGHNYASNGKGNLGVTLGAIGTGLGVLGNGLFNGGLANIFGNGSCGYNRNANGCCCSDDELVTRYDAGKDARIATLEMEKALLEANAFADKTVSYTHLTLPTICSV